MKRIFKKDRIIFVSCFTFLFVLGYSCQKAANKDLASVEESAGIAKPPQRTKNFRQVNLVSSTEKYPALLIDLTLLNPRGYCLMVPELAHGRYLKEFPTGNPTTYNKNHLYFTAGPDNEEGIFGYIK